MRGATLVITVIAVLSSLGARAHPREVQQDTRKEVSMNDHPFVGDWVANISKSKLDQPLKGVTLRIDATGDSMTMSSHLTLASGQEQRAAETFRTDGTETQGTLTAGVTLVAKWLDPYVLASLAKKGGNVLAIVTYEVSPDRQTLTSRSSGMVEQTIVFDRSFQR